MAGFVSGLDRSQGTMFPAQLEDYVAEDNPVRVIDLFVEQLDLTKLGFGGVTPKDMGRPAYHPAVMLKIYVYGYLNRVQSSRRLERECQRNVEAIWLTGRLAPDFKTIADFRKDNGPAIRKVCREFIALCGRAGLLAATTVAIDGSKFKAVNSRDRNFTKAKIGKRLEQIEASIARYLSELETADRQPSTPEIKIARLNGKIAKLKQEIERMKTIGAELAEAEETQISLTDPDARSMQGTGKATGTVGYNVQCAVETEHHLIVAHEVTNAVNDRNQLSGMAAKAKEALGAEAIEALADRGFHDGKELLACHEAGVTAYVPSFSTSNAKAEGRFDKRDFVYKANEDVYLCPAGERLAYRFTNEEDGKVMRRYSTTACSACPLKEQCTTGKERRIARWEHEAVVEAAQERLDNSPDMMTVRRSTVEHTFGTLKFWMGHTHFLMKTLHNVRTEMSLHVLAYNMKRVMKILGVPGLLQALLTWPPIYYLLLVLACAASSNGPDRLLNRLRAILARFAKSAPMRQRSYAVA
jgi:transposase